MKYSLVIFDLDGTCFDTSKGIIATCDVVLEEFGYPPVKKEDYDRLIGPSLQSMFGDIAGMKEEHIDEAVDRYIDLYAHNGAHVYTPYPHLGTIVEKLHSAGVKLAVATLKDHRYAKYPFEGTGLDKYFGIVQGSDYDNHIYNKEDTINECLKYHGVDGTKALMIGDSLFDAVGAKACGCDFAAVTYGFGIKDEDEAKTVNPKFISNSLKELMAQLKI